MEIEIIKDMTKKVVLINYGNTKVKAILPVEVINELDKYKYSNSYTYYYKKLLERVGIKYDSNSNKPLCIQIMDYEKKIYHGILEGSQFLCKKDMFINNYPIYIKGKIYRSDIEDCITDELGCTSHRWDSPIAINEYFEMI